MVTKRGLNILSYFIGLETSLPFLFIPLPNERENLQNGGVPCKVMMIAENGTWSHDRLTILVLVSENMDEGFALPPSIEVSASQSIERPTRRANL